MKRLLLFVAVALSVAVASAQSVKFSAPDVEVKFKRCIAMGSNAYIDLVMTNWTGKDLNPYCYNRVSLDGVNHFTSAYDDEGNMYKGFTNLSVLVGGENVSNGRFAFPREIPVKIRVYIKNLNEYASEIKLLKLAFIGMVPTDYYGYAVLEIRGIPITRQ